MLLYRYPGHEWVKRVLRFPAGRFSFLYGIVDSFIKIEH